MRKYTWEEYYEKFYDWAESTRVRNLSELISLGSADEVGEIIIELQFDNINASNRLLKRAVNEMLAFSSDDLIGFLYSNDKQLATAAVYNSANRLTGDDIEDLYTMVDDDVIIKICSEYSLSLPDGMRNDEDVIDSYIHNVFSYAKPKKFGFAQTLFGKIGEVGEINKTKHKKHGGKCNGDCANCPEHYGYRYGRWYYGKGHIYGCEFGGNKGDGSLW